MTCHDCIHDEVCDSYGYPFEPCEYFKDKSRYPREPFLGEYEQLTIDFPK